MSSRKKALPTPTCATLVSLERTHVGERAHTGTQHPFPHDLVDIHALAQTRVHIQANARARAGVKDLYSLAQASLTGTRTRVEKRAHTNPPCARSHSPAKVLWQVCHQRTSPQADENTRVHTKAEPQCTHSIRAHKHDHKTETCTRDSRVQSTRARVHAKDVACGWLCVRCSYSAVRSLRQGAVTSALKISCSTTYQPSGGYNLRPSAVARVRMSAHA